MRLGTWLPSFAQAARALAYFTGVEVSAATARRRTEAAGAVAVALHAAEVDRLERDRPPPPPGPPVQQLSADGAMVPLVGGEWAEVKTAAVGVVEAARGADGAPATRTRAVSYVARLADCDAFGRAALPELHRRGTETAGTVVAVTDGSEWLQGFVDLHRPDAVRVLDFPHAVEHLNSAAQAAWGVGAPEAAAWLAQQARELGTGDPDAVLAALRALPVHDAADPAAAARARDETLGYLERRRAQIAYARFRACGFPVGSGIVESANKLVVEERLKGPGMHWARQHVDPMLALRCLHANDRWAEAWAAIAPRLRAPARASPARGATRAGLSAARANRAVHRPRAPTRLRLRPAPARPPRTVAGRPTPDHPLKQRPILRGEQLRQMHAAKR